MEKGNGIRKRKKETEKETEKGNGKRKRKEEMEKRNGKGKQKKGTGLFALFCPQNNLQSAMARATSNDTFQLYSSDSVFPSSHLFKVH
jgi:hypothetical protein